MSNISVQQLLATSANTKTTGNTASSSASFASTMALQMMSQATTPTQNDDTLLDSSGSLLGAGLMGGMDMSALLGGDMEVRDLMLMFCMMLSFGGSSSDSMGFMLTSLAAALQNTSAADVETLRNDILNADFSNDVLSQANNTFFSNTTDAIIPYDAWKAVTPSVTSTMANRSAALYRSVLNQFNVTSNPRYKVNKNGTGDTYCNIYLWDVTRAMGAEIPHYIDAKTNTPRYYPDVKGATELSANGIYDWLKAAGGRYGWQQVTAEQAQALANAGKPVVTTWKNPSGSGHVQMVCPSQNGQYDPVRGVTIAQAGSKLYDYAYITQVYKDPGKVLYYAHA